MAEMIFQIKRWMIIDQEINWMKIDGIKKNDFKSFTVWNGALCFPSHHSACISLTYNYQIIYFPSFLSFRSAFIACRRKQKELQGW
jgi:hypothetical protein